MTNNMRGHRRGHQRGAVTLMVTLGLCSVLLLATLFAHRGGLIDARLSTQQVRATVAFEAAEAGIDWAITQLNQPQRIGPDCRSNTGAAAFSFRERYLAMNPACVRTVEGWACNCPSDGMSSPGSLGNAASTPAFSLRFAPGHESGSVRVTSTGGSGTSRDASARVEVLLASLPALASAPAAPLTVRGDVATPAAIGWHNSDPRSGGVAVHAGGTIAAPQARIGAPAGSSTTRSLAAHDAVLAETSAERLFTAYFGLPKNTWREQEIVLRVACPGPCATALAEALRNDPQASHIAIDGDLDLEGPLTLGSTEHPLVIVASGSIRLRSAVQMHGVLYGENISWQQATAPEAFVRGALIAEGSYSGDASADLVYDTTVLDTLRRQRGSFVRVPAGWRDF